jgi:hypothetical protein
MSIKNDADLACSLGCFYKLICTLVDVAKASHRDVFMRFSSMAYSYATLYGRVRETNAYLDHEASPEQIVSQLRAWMMLCLKGLPKESKKKLSQFFFSDEMQQLEQYLLSNKDAYYKIEHFSTKTILQPNHSLYILSEYRSIISEVTSQVDRFHLQFSDFLSRSLWVGHHNKSVSGAWCCIQKNWLSRVRKSSSQCMRSYYRHSIWGAKAFNFFYICGSMWMLFHVEMLLWQWHFFWLLSMLVTMYGFFLVLIRVNRYWIHHVKHENTFDLDKHILWDVKKSLLFHGACFLVEMIKKDSSIDSGLQEKLRNILEKEPSKLATHLIEEDLIQNHCEHVFKVLEYHKNIGKNDYAFEDENSFPDAEVYVRAKLV